jgi:hypothetical protein
MTSRAINVIKDSKSQGCRGWIEGYRIELKFGNFIENRRDYGGRILVLQNLIWLCC